MESRHWVGGSAVAMMFVLFAVIGLPPASAGTGPAAMAGWSLTGSMATERYGHTATRLLDGRVLVAGGANSTGLLGSSEIYDPVSMTWSATGSLSTARTYAAATRLLDGRVLVIGGFGLGGQLSSCEIYDPASGSWSPTASMTSAREYATTTLLPDGNVLVAGGLANGPVLASAEIYDPNSGTWSSTGSMAKPRFSHTATLLRDGTVLVAGGSGDPFGGFSWASAEIYDPFSGTWSPTGGMSQARDGHIAIRLRDGRVLVAGGYNGLSGELASAEIYDQASGTWIQTGSMGGRGSAQRPPGCPTAASL